MSKIALIFLILAFVDVSVFARPISETELKEKLTAKKDEILKNVWKLINMTEMVESVKGTLTADIKHLLPKLKQEDIKMFKGLDYNNYRDYSTAASDLTRNSEESSRLSELQKHVKDVLGGLESGAANFLENHLEDFIDALKNVFINGGHGAEEQAKLWATKLTERFSKLPDESKSALCKAFPKTAEYVDGVRRKIEILVKGLVIEEVAKLTATES
jgi:hypothetical protein